MSDAVAYLSVGSNIGPERHVPAALAALCAVVDVTGVSTHYRTEPLGAAISREVFLNGVWRFESSLPLDSVRRLLRSIESREGRIRGPDRNAPRTLDLDLLLWGATVDREAGIPDGDVLTRPFLYHPLIELDPRLLWPTNGRPLRDMPPPVPLAAMEPDWEMTERLRGLIDG